MRIRSILLAGLLATTGLFGQAQEQRDLKKEVKVRTNFKPKIKKAKRIGEMPNIVDTVKVKKRFDYSIKRKSLDVSFKPGSIKAVGITNSTDKKLHGHSFDLAAGNYATLFADYRYNNLHSEKIDFGLHLQHYSSTGEIKFEDGRKSKPDWKEFLAEVYGNYYMDDVKLNSRLFYKQKAFNYYGAPLFTDLSNKASVFNYNDQTFKHVGLNTSYETLNQSDNDLNYKLGLGFEYFTDKHDANEFDLALLAKADLPAGQGKWSLENTLNFIQSNKLMYWDNGSKDHDVNSTLWTVNPSYNLTVDKFNMKLGFKVQSVFGNDSDFRLYPDVKLNLGLVDQVLDMFAGLDGQLQLNTLRSISEVNPFVHSGLDVESTSTNYRVYGGLKTRISAKSKALFSVEYAQLDHHYFFSMANDAISPQGQLPSQIHYTNKYAVVYDDIAKLSFTGEIDLQVNNELSLYTLAKYSHYAMDRLNEAWHMPKFEMETKASYAFTDELNFTARLILVGERPVMTDGLEAQLDALADFGLGAEYKWNDMLSVYANINNILNADSFLWYGYPSQGINGMMGLRLIF